MDIRGTHRDQFLRILHAACRKQDCGIGKFDFVVTFTNEGEEKIFGQSGDISESELLDACQYIKQVRSRRSGTLKVAQLLEASQDPVPSLEDLSIRNAHLPSLTPLSHAIKSKNLPILKLLSLSTINVSNDLGNDEDGELLAGRIASANLLSLKVLSLHNVQLGGGHLTLAKAMESGKMLTLEKLGLSSTSLGDDGCKAYSIAIRSGKLKNLAVLDLEGNKITDEGLIALLGAFQVSTPIVLPNLQTLDLSSNKFTEQSLLRLVEALELGCLNSLHYLDFDDTSGSEKAAEAFVSTLAKSAYLIDDLHLRKTRLLERNSRNNDLLGIGGYVSAEFSKVYLCGHSEVGKTTFRHTLETVQMSRLKALIKPRSAVDGCTRGIEVSPILSKSKGSKSGENSTTLLVWDMAGQEDYHLLHNEFFQDSDSARGKATTFLIVCSLKSVRNNLEESQKQLVYWLRFIASSCNKNAGNPRHVLTVLNNFLPDINLEELQKYWQHVLEDQREKFAGRLDIQTNPFVGDIRKASLVKDIKKNLLNHSRDSLRDEKVPKICHFIQENLSAWSEPRKQFPVLLWEDFMTLVHKSSSEQTLEADRKYLWPEKVLEAATKYLHEAGALIFINRKFPFDWGISDRKLVVLNPTWFCNQVVGDMYLHQDMAFPAQRRFRKRVEKQIGLFRMKVDRKGRISEEEFKKFFKSSLKLGGEWSETELRYLIEILLWFGLCYQGRNQDLFIPSLIEEIGTPEVRWGSCNSKELGQEQWVMGFSVEHHKNDLTIAPIALWHRFQVELAQSPKFNDRPDNDFVCGRHFVTFTISFMKVLVKVNVNKASPTFYDVNIFVKPLLHENDCSIKQRRQLQIDLASDLVEVLLGLWEQVCPGVEYLQRVVWPWPASSSGFHVSPDRNLDVEEAKELVQKHGLGWRMHWEVGTNATITVDQLLSTKDKDRVMKNYLLTVL